MSTDHGLPPIIDSAIKRAQAELAVNAQELQANFLADPMTSEEALEARNQIGKSAGPLAIANQVSLNRKGRPKGARNKRTDDTVAYLRQFGPDPAIVAMKIMAETEEAMVERSRLIDPPKKHMSFLEARNVRMRMAELMKPVFHGNKPVQVDHRFGALPDLLVEGLTHTPEEIVELLDGEFFEVDRPE